MIIHHPNQHTLEFLEHPAVLEHRQIRQFLELLDYLEHRSHLGYQLHPVDRPHPVLLHPVNLDYLGSPAYLVVLAVLDYPEGLANLVCPVGLVGLDFLVIPVTLVGLEHPEYLFVQECRNLIQRVVRRYQ